MQANPMKNVMSVDVEDYFHVEAFASNILAEEWHSYPPRVDRNVSRILELFAKYRVRATFFLLGWVAEKFPHLSQEIAAAGHEIGCHGYAHRRLHTMTPGQFQQDLRRATALLSDQAGRPIRSFRAPSFSIVRATLWAYDILSEEGYSFDSSVFPVRHDLYGIPDAKRFPHWTTLHQNAGIFEFPLSTLSYHGVNVGVGGGGYLRWIPYGITYWALRRINLEEHQPVAVYFHPWEIDPDQPRLRAGIKSRLRHYTNLSTTEGKIERLLHDFQFSTLSEVCLAHPNYMTKPFGRPADVGAYEFVENT
jgi:polysaccharide deacetylase family protein (PEP-CTERM system associated)